jgi:hypothetical protein
VCSGKEVKSIKNQLTYVQKISINVVWLFYSGQVKREAFIAAVVNIQLFYTCIEPFFDTLDRDLSCNVLNKVIIKQVGGYHRQKSRDVCCLVRGGMFHFALHIELPAVSKYCDTS